MRTFRSEFPRVASFIGLFMLAPLCAGAQEQPQPPPAYNSATSLTSNSPTLTLPGSLTLTSVVSAPNGGGVPTGKVTFDYDTTNSLGTANLTILTKTEAFPTAPSNAFAFGTEPFPFWATSLFSATEMDLAIIDQNLSTSDGSPIVTIFPGLGRGGFGTPTPHTVEINKTLPNGAYIDAIASGDFHNDGNQEFLLHLKEYGESSGPVPSAYDMVDSKLTDTFIGVPPPCAEGDPNCNFNDQDNEVLAVDDFNGDGYADVGVLVTNYFGVLQNYLGYNPVTQPRIRIGINNKGTAGVPFFSFGPNATLPTFVDTVNTGATDYYCPQAIATGQFRKNGSKDVVSVGRQSVWYYNSYTGGYYTNYCTQPSSPGYLVLLLGDGTGNLTSQTPIQLGSSPAAVGVGDFNKDGNLDAVVVDQVDNTVEILYGKGDGTFSAQPFTITAGNGPDSIQVADFNGDGYPDVAIGDYADGIVYLLLNDGTGKLLAPVNVYAGIAAEPVAILAQDMNGDGLADLTALSSRLIVDGGTAALAAAATNNVAVLLNSASAQATLTTAMMTLPSGNRTLTANFPGDLNFNSSTSAGDAVVVMQTPSVIQWLAPAAIQYGTQLSATQLDATASLPGTFAYTPPAGTVLNAGTQTLSALFVPTDNFNYSNATATVPITVTKAPSVITWPPPAAIEYGTPLGATQLNASANIPGTFVYTPAAGTILTPGTSTLSVAFTPANAVDYNPATATVSISVNGASLVSIAPTNANLGSAAFNLTVVGQGFTQGATVLWNGSPLSTSYVDLNHLIAQVPASLLKTVGTATVTVMDPASVPVAGSAIFTITPPPAVATATAPQTSDPATDQSVQLTLSPYPADITVTLTLSFAPTPPNTVGDPAVLFANGTTVDTFVVPANSTAAIAPVSFQTGTTAGTITITFQLTAGGANVTPSTLAPIVVTVPALPPVITSAKLTRNGQSIQLVIEGISSTRDMSQAEFQFTPASGATLKTTDLTVSLSGAFTTWYSDATSDAFGTAFQYTQPFTLDSNATDVQSVTVTLTNSVGPSQPATAQ
ncbi:VCBS repeat-containing protein [Alloacidobacterium dinghuense]|uniref:VCBS repeat-containing protein n=1 Tax=Alloacidobacterium dinghuense TaxID=2763107 RepID=A0A7G8BJY1_9BACT|nr:VCBS repeat-containing protein [Alloacidobacterium dinghuense]QNI32851.1 VCBS repeat-containing protein [Alloacidobacterium dinghuense]